MLTILFGLALLGAPDRGAPDVVWVFFRDKGPVTGAPGAGVPDSWSTPLNSPALARRILNLGKISDFNDLPVFQRYVDDIARRGAVLRCRSNWLNAASFRIPSSLQATVANLPFVTRVAPVAVYRQAREAEPERRPAGSVLRNGEGLFSGSALPPSMPSARADAARWKDFYGPCYTQAAMMNVPRVYFSGYTGSGVTIGMLDTGFKRKHSAVRNIRVAREHDFITGDNIVVDDSAVVRNVVLGQNPLLHLDRLNRIHLFYASDTLSAGVYNRPLWWATGSGATAGSWQPVAISAPLTDIAASNPTVVGAGTDTIFLAWQGFNASWNPRVNFGYYDGTWRGIQFVTSGALPALARLDSILFLFYVADDSILAFRTGTVSGGGVSWSPSRTLSTGSERIGWTQAVIDPAGRLYVAWTGIASGTIKFCMSADSGTAFSTPSAAAFSAGKTRMVLTGTTLHLFFTQYDSIPFLSHRQSTDGGATWTGGPLGMGDTLSDFTVAADSGHLTVLIEKQGAIKKIGSDDGGTSWTADSLVDAAEFCHQPTAAGRSVAWLVRGDDNTDYDETQDNIQQPNHGTRMLSAIASYQPGSFMGIAPGADFLVAKTEKYIGRGATDKYEFSVEEDTWIEGLEWLERSGADLVTSSLGYIDWYSHAQLDGKTAPVSVAAALAAKRGLLVVTAAGNRPSTNIAPYLNAPADADGIIAMGGVKNDSAYTVGTPVTDSIWWTGSGFGPTADNRRKPELIAPGDGVWAVDPDSTSSALVGAGTSFSTALAAGACALIKEAHPDWTLDSLKAVLFRTASNFEQPSDTLGYGLPDVNAAVQWSRPVTPPFSGNALLDPYPNPFVPVKHGTVSLPFLILQPSTVDIRIVTLDGLLVRTISPAKDSLNPLFLPGRYENRNPASVRAAATWDGTNDSGRAVASGVYIALLQTGYGGTVKKIIVVR